MGSLLVTMKRSKHKFPAAQKSIVFPSLWGKLTEGCFWHYFLWYLLYLFFQIISNVKCRNTPNLSFSLPIAANTSWHLYSLLLTFPLTFLLTSCFWVKETNYWALPVFSILDVLSGYQPGLLFQDLAGDVNFYEPQVDLSTELKMAI